MGRPHTTESRARISRGVTRWHARRREAARVRPTHVDRWMRDGAVHPALRPIVAARASQVEQMVQDLGGPDEVTAMQRGVLEGWIQAQVAADVEFSRLIQDPKAEIPERLLTGINSARSALVALGLTRRARDLTPSVTEYLAAKASQAAPAELADIDGDATQQPEENR